MKNGKKHDTKMDVNLLEIKRRMLIQGMEFRKKILLLKKSLIQKDK
jgi:hypothetical protein